MGTYRDLTVYKKSFKLAMTIFDVSELFPKHEKYDLTSQIRRSSRSVCATIAEAYRKRLYRDYFVSKSSDADMENTEVQVWLDFALQCKYISDETYEELINDSNEIGRLLNHMVTNPDNYIGHLSEVRKTNKPTSTLQIEPLQTANLK
ncbi:MAG: four helix bundle protein [Flavobacteriales bacterium]